MKQFAQFTKLVLGAALVVGIATHANANTLQSTSSAESDRVNMDIGLTVGTPGGLNLGITKWGIGSIPLLVRASGMYLGKNIWGVQPELGIAFDTEGNFRQYFAAAYTRTSIFLQNRGSGLDWEGVGPVYGINWYGFSAQVGVSFGKGVSTEDFVARQITTPQLIAQLGYAFYF